MSIIVPRWLASQTAFHNLQTAQCWDDCLSGFQCLNHRHADRSEGERPFTSFQLMCFIIIFSRVIDQSRDISPGWDVVNTHWCPKTNSENVSILQLSHLKWQNVSVCIILLDFQCFGSHCSKYLLLSCTVHLRLPSLIVCLSDLSCGGERSLSLYKAAVWAVLLSPDHHLPRPLLWFH